MLGSIPQAALEMRAAMHSGDFEKAADATITVARAVRDAALEEAAKVVESQCRGMDEGVWCSLHPGNAVSDTASFQPCRMHKNAERIRALKLDR